MNIKGIINAIPPSLDATAAPAKPTNTRESIKPQTNANGSNGLKMPSSMKHFLLGRPFLKII